MDPGTATVAAAGIGAASNLLGGAFGSKDEVDWSGAKRGIRWKVKDAKKAGIHPLYAIGAPSIGGVTTRVDGLGSAIRGAGESIASGVSRYGKLASEEALRLSQMEQLHAQTDAARAQAKSDNAMAMYNSARAAKMVQELVSGKGRVVIGEPTIEKGLPPKDSTRHYRGPFGLEWQTKPGRDQAQGIEDEYSEAGSWPYGAASVVEDIIYNVGKNYRSPKKYGSGWSWK